LETLPAEQDHSYNATQIRTEILYIAKRYLFIPPQQQSISKTRPIPDYVLKARQKYPRAYEPWTSEEEKRLSELAETQKPLSEISQILQRGFNSIRKKAENLIIELVDDVPDEEKKTYTPYPEWSSEEEKTLITYIQQGLNSIQIGEKLNRKRGDIRRKVKQLGLDLKKQYQYPRTNHRWEPDEDEILMTLVENNWSHREIAGNLQRGEAAIKLRIAELRNAQVGSPRKLGLHPNDNGQVLLLLNKDLGPIIVHGNQSVVIPYHLDPKQISLEEAIGLISGNQ